MTFMSRKKSEAEHQRNLISTIAETYEFEEIYSTKESSNDDEEVSIKTITKGVFKSKDHNYLGIFCKFINPKVLKPAMEFIFENRVEIERIYEGEKYLLCLINKKVYSYNIKYYRTLLEIISDLEFELGVKGYKLTIGIDSKPPLHALILETEVADFVLAGLIEGKYDEEERVILSNKLEASQPFFKFKSPIHFDWNTLVGDKDRQFERICELLLQKENNIIRIIPIGKTRAADRGRDFEVIEKVDGISEASERKWLVQCKFSESSISPSSIAGWTDRVIEHSYYGYWLMTNNDITPNLFDQFKDVEKNKEYEIKTKFWQRSDFYIKLNVHSELFTKNDIFKIE